MSTKIQKLGPNQKKWLRALESGKFRRGEGNLTVGEGKLAKHCCLGVACIVLGCPVTGINQYSGAIEYGSKRECAFAPVSIVRALGLHDERGTRLSDGCVEGSLVEMNDRKGSSFKRIAAAVRKNPAEFFRRPK